VRETIAAKRAGVVYVAAVGEQLPIASGSADIVIIENCLDHADEPRRVLSEIARVLKPGGLLWLLVDFMDYRDHMHPSPLQEVGLRGMLAEQGFVVRYLASWEPGSHPRAERQCRVLAERGA
jgi:ubiquinone/menaquinone biosynthesis C-methylase UbiE